MTWSSTDPIWQAVHAELTDKGELTAADLVNRIRINHDHKVTEHQMRSALRSWAMAGRVRALANIKKITIWGLPR